ncbi:MAG: pyruvate dehydrogenase (acetyl-transferring) E1 component subunit alpha [Nitriliruptoraceae bacterium]
MPRTEVALEARLERLEIMDADGRIDEDLLPELDGQLLVDLHRAMVLGRRFDERRLRLQRQGRIGTFAPTIGQEAAQLGAISALEATDWFVPSYREAPMALWRGTTMEALLLYDAGYNEGAEPAEDSTDLPISVPVSSQVPHATGLAYAAKLRGTGQVVLVSFGDGATSEGDFHEAVNVASVHGAPVVFLCQNNQYAISTPTGQQTGATTFVQKAVAYGIPGLQVDGNDLFAVYAATHEAVERARSGGGPTLIEAVTYRLSVHTTADDPSTYRDEGEEERWWEKDPIERLRRYLVDEGLLSTEQVDAVEEEVADAIEQAWARASELMDELGDPAVMFDHVYAERPAYLEEQREGFLAARGEGSSDG